MTATVNTLKSTPRIVIRSSAEQSSFMPPRIGQIVGSALQAEISDLNRATLRLLATAARLGSSEPLAAALLGTSNEVISLFGDVGRDERILSKTLGFPLVQLRFNDPTTVRLLLQSGAVDAASIMAITRTFPLEVIEGTQVRMG